MRSIEPGTQGVTKRGVFAPGFRAHGFAASRNDEAFKPLQFHSDASLAVAEAIQQPAQIIALGLGAFGVLGAAADLVENFARALGIGA